MSFKNLKKLDVRDGSVRYPLVQIEGEPFLLVRPATEANKPFFNAVMKRSKTSIRRLRAGKFDAATLAAHREEDRELYPQHIITGWGKVVDDDGKLVEFSQEKCAEFITQLPNWIFDELREFCGNPSNHVRGDDVPSEEELSGN